MNPTLLAIIRHGESQAKYILVSESPTGRKFFVSLIKWSDEFPDASRFTRKEALRIKKEYGLKTFEIVDVEKYV